ncbi:MAG: hypothetical protein CL692_00660 [Cellvibrionales bacterium]|nr:hypothetical protein [Cellvibrionales bacterium]
MLGSEKKPFYYVIVLLLGSLIAWLIATSKPAPIVTPLAVPKDVVVDVALFDVKSHRVWLKSQGLVTAEITSVLSAQVAGRIKQIDNAFVAGGRFEDGQVLLSLEDDDYRNAIFNAEAELANAQQLLASELGKVKQAKREWRDLGDKASNDLFLRTPQLASARSAVAGAEAYLQQAQLNLSRTKIKAPFTGQLLSKHADLGQYVSQGMPLADIYSTASAEVRLPITADQRALITVGSKGSHQVNLFAKYGAKQVKWTAYIDRIEAAVDVNSRQYYLVASLKNPFQPLTKPQLETNSLEPPNPPLAIGQYLTAKIEGDYVDGSIRIPRKALRQQNLIWLLINGRLVNQAIIPLQIDRDFALVQLPKSFDGQRDLAVIVSDLPFAFEGMQLLASNAEQRHNTQADSMPVSDTNALPE